MTFEKRNSKSGIQKSELKKNLESDFEKRSSKEELQKTKFEIASIN